MSRSNDTTLKQTDISPQDVRLWPLITVPLRFILAIVLIAFFAGLVEALFPGGTYVYIGIVLTIAIACLIRPIQFSSLKFRSTASGLLAGALLLFAIQTEAINDADGSKSNAKKETPNILNDKEKQAEWIWLSKDSVKQRLRDPKSAQFKNVFFHAYQNKTPVVCGLVNGKNGFGGYSNYQGFIASGKDIVFMESDFKPGEFLKTWNEMCVK